MPSLGWQELMIVLVIVIIIFGAGKLPEIGGALGKSIKEFKHQSEGDEQLTEGSTAQKTVDQATTSTSTVVEQREVRAEEI